MLRHSSALAADPAGPTVVLSPHLDDAVLNCWSVLTRPGDVRVVNVFAASPGSGFVTEIDRICGAVDSAAHMTERRREDSQALALAGRSPTNLTFLDRQYRAVGRTLALRDVDVALRSLGGVAHLYAPAAHGVRVSLYADLPYAVAFGWPGWVTGEDEDPHRDVDVFWQPLLRAAPEIGHLRRAEVVRLPDAERERKLDAMRAYRTQFPALDGGAVHLLSNPLVHGFEVFWTIPAERAVVTRR
jgi:LmbE family N-acetylglucosaminyl deacetylase